jgi:hypothetical protein
MGSRVVSTARSSQSTAVLQIGKPPDRDLSHFPSSGVIQRFDARTGAWPRINQKWRMQ